MMLALSSCESFPPPKAETCIGTNEGDLACDDPRLDEEKRSYFRGLKKGDMCTNPTDYQGYFNYCENLRKELIKCQRDKSNM